MDTPTKLILGLGNPGADYEHTRHNVGFDIIDRFAAVHGIGVARRDFRGLTGDGTLNGVRVFLLKPQTYMNLSGESLALFLRRKPVPLSDILVVADDIALPTGKLRLRPAGSAGGHNGLKSIAQNVQSQDFARLRVGVGAPRDPSVQVDFVLGRFPRDEREIVDEAIDRAVAALETWIADGIEPAMNRFNRE
jgi:PTH1 family peptidyl-tRNA hydrolase